MCCPPMTVVVKGMVEVAEEELVVERLEVVMEVAAVLVVELETLVVVVNVIATLEVMLLALMVVVREVIGVLSAAKATLEVVIVEVELSNSIESLMAAGVRVESILAGAVCSSSCCGYKKTKTIII